MSGRLARLRRFARLFAADLRHGLRAIGRRLALAMVVSVAVGFVGYANLVMNAPELRGTLTLGDCVFVTVGGMERFVVETGATFRFPMTWLVLFITASYAVFDYPVRDLAGMGARIIATTGGRWQWWLATCAWTATCALLMWVMTLATCASVELVDGGGWSLAPMPDIATRAGLNGWGTLEVDGDMLGFALAAPMVLCALFLVQLVASLVTGPLVGLALTAGTLLLSAFHTGPLLPGNYLMAARQGIALADGVDPATGAILGLAVSALCVLLGGVWFSRRDIISRRDDLS